MIRPNLKPYKFKGPVPVKHPVSRVPENKTLKALFLK